MYSTSSFRVNDVPLDIFRLMVALEETRLVVGDNWVWVILGDIHNEIMFFLSQEDSETYIKEIGEEEE